MTLKAHVRYFVRHHLFGLRIFAPNLFNMVFWILVIAGIDIGGEKGLVPGSIGGVAGVVSGIVFLGFCYALYVMTHRDEFKVEPGALPNADATGGTPSTPPSNPRSQ